MKTGIIFDLDGTLWDACRVIAESWTQCIQENYPEYGITLTEEDFRRTCGLTMEKIGDILFPSIPKRKRDEVTHTCCEFEVEYMKTRPGEIYQGLTETFDQLIQDGNHLYMVSNCQAGYIEDFLSQSGADRYIEDYEDYGRTGLDKNENIRLLYQRNHLDRGIYVGDTQGDYDHAMNSGCGLYFIHAAYGFGRVKENVPAVQDLRELPAKVREVLGQVRCAAPDKGQRQDGYPEHV